MKLEPTLRNFLARHADDDRARLVRVELAWILIETGRFAEARRMVEPVRNGPVGRARDFSSVAEAAILIRQGQADAALELLRPLRGRLIDSEERLVFGEEIVRAALAARHHAEAIDYLVEWLAQAPAEDSERVELIAETRLERIPTPALERALRELDREGAAGAESSALAPAKSWMIKALRARLTRIALEQQDGELARRLLETAPPSLRHADEGKELTRIATTGPVLPRVAGRAIGLALSLGDAATRRRSASAMTGLSRALGLAAQRARSDAIELVTHDDEESGGVERALAALAGEGAAILVAGVDGEGATRAARYADDAEIPVILLYPPKEAPKPDGFAFVLGIDAGNEDIALSAAFEERGISRIARIGQGGVPCSVAPAAAGLPRFPVQDWKRDHTDALLVIGDAACARDALAESLAAGVHPVLGLGLEAGELFADGLRQAPRLAVSTGAFPYRPRQPASEAMDRFRAALGTTPGWFEVLGRDAAVLASSVFLSFPQERVEDARAVQKLHRLARDRLQAANVTLWSSEVGGFGGRRVLERKLGTISSGGTAARKK